MLGFKMITIDSLKLKFKEINDLFIKGKYDLVIEKSKKIIKKNPNQIPFYNLLALSYREKNQLFLGIPFNYKNDWRI